jgi:hypothetical protein
MDQDRQSIIDTEKFSKVFGSIEKQMLMQSSFLESIYNINTQQLDMERDRAKKEAARLAALSAQGTEETVGGATTTGAGSVDLGAASDKQKESILSSIIPGIGNFIGSLFGTIGGIGLAGLGSKVIGAGALAILAPAVGNFIAEFSKSALEDWNPGATEFNTGVSAALGKATTWGLIGNIFGKKMGLIFAAGAAGTSLGDTIFNSLDSNKDGLLTAFGLTFGDTEFQAVGGAIGGALGLFLPGMVKSALGPVFAAMTLPGVGLVALSAAALLTGAYLVDNWMTERRKELIDGINNELEEGLKNFKAEKDRSVLEQIGTSIFGADEDDPLGAKLDVLDSRLAAMGVRQGREAARAGKKFTGLDLNAIEGEEKAQLEEVKQNLKAALSGADVLTGLSIQKLEQLSRITSLFDLDTENKKVNDQLNILKAEADAAADKALMAKTRLPPRPGYGPGIVPMESADVGPTVLTPEDQARVNRESEYGIDRDRQREIRYDRSMAALSKIESASSSTPIIVPVPMVTPAQNAAAAPSQIDQSTISNSTTIFAGRSKFDELDTFVIGAR